MPSDRGELVEAKRVACRRLKAGGRKGGVGAGAERAADQRSHRIFPKGPDLDDPGPRVREDGRQHLALSAGLRGPGRDRDENRQAIEPI